MKKIMLAAAMLLAAASLIIAQNNALQIRATGTGRTTGHIANLSVYNPTTAPATFTLLPCYIPSGGQHQPYIVPNAITINVSPGATANIPVEGYCADIFTAPVPSGAAMPPFSGWLTSDQSSTAAILLDAIGRISTAFDQMQSSGAISTPFSGNPEKEREAVIQQTFWVVSGENAGKTYEKEQFKANTIKQFETTTGLDFERTDEVTQQNVNAGIDQFWSTFQAVGTAAKVLINDDEHDGETVEIADRKKDKCGCDEMTVEVSIAGQKIEVKTDKFDRQVVEKHEIASQKIDENKMIPVSITKLVVKCSCDAGACTACSANTTSAKMLKALETNEAYAEAEAAKQKWETELKNRPVDQEAADAAKKDYDDKLKKAKDLEKENGKINGDYKSIPFPTVKNEKIGPNSATGAWNPETKTFEHLEGWEQTVKGFRMGKELTYEFTVESSCVNGDCKTGKCTKSFKFTLENKK